MGIVQVHNNKSVSQRRVREWLLLGFLLLGTGALLALLLWVERTNTENAERDRLEVQTRVIGEYLEHQFGGINNALQGIRDEVPSWQGVGFQERASSRLKLLADAMPGVRLMGIVDAQGLLLAVSRPELLGADRSQREFFRTPKSRPDPGMLYVSDPYLGSRGVSSIMVGRVLLDHEGGFAGLVYAKLDPEFFNVVMRSVLYAPDMLTSLSTNEGQLFLSETSGKPLLQTDLSGPNSLFVRHRDSGEPSNFYRDTAQISGQDSLMALRTVNPATIKMANPLIIQVGRAYSAALQPWRDRMWLALALYGVLALVAVIGLHLRQRYLRTREQLRAQQQQLLRQNEERLELALEGAELGLWDRNFSTNVRTYNERWSAMLGYSSREIDGPGTAWQDLLHPDDLAATSEALGRHIHGETSYFESEHRLRHKNGRWVWVLARGRVVERDADGLPVRMVGTQMDISVRKHVEKVLRESEERFRSLSDLSSDWYWETDEQFRFTRIEGSQEATTGMSPHADIGCYRWDVMTLNMSDADWDEHRAALQAHQVFRDLEMERLDADGQRIWVSVSGAPFFDEQGHFQGYRGVGRNITQRKLAEQKIEQLAFYDVLTNLPNRRMLTDRLQKALASVARSRRHGALIFIDLDNFKDLNDTEGHDMGDLLLQQVAVRLRECVREIDTVARLGGDEFVVMLEELSPYAGEAAVQADVTGKKIMALLNQPFELRGQHHHSTPSIGIALFHDQVQSVDELLKRADLAMYQAKAAGRNALRFFDPGMQAAATARAVLEADLRQGLQREELRLHYQVVVDENSHVCGVEALVRWQHPQRGLMQPGEFVEMAEQTGLIILVGHWVLQAACEQLVVWADDADTAELSIAVNVSARQFRQTDFVLQVQDLLRKTGANPYRLKLELTESMLLSDVEDAIRKMTKLRMIGVSFSLDDFGTGYSSLSYLKSLPLDQLKIDKSFIRDVLTNANDAAIVRTILALARSLDLVVVAEGVETEGQRQLLLDSGCWAFQGYLFGQPVPVQDLVLTPEESLL